MLKRLSSTFKKDKKAPNGTGVTYANGTNGVANGANGTNGVSEKPSRRKSSFGIGKEKSSEKEGKLDIAANREEVDHVFAEFSQLIHCDNSPVPTPLTDGTTFEAESSGVWGDLKALGFKDIKTLKEVMANKAKGDFVDDKTYLMERVIQLVSSLPANSKNRVELTNSFLDELWNSLQHPPLSYMGDKFTYRQADGSYNNIMYPHLGAANTPYARSVQPMTIQPGALPDPGLVFDAGI